MKTRPKQSEAQLLENHRVALENVETQPAVAALMTELGYETAKLAEGKTLLSAARTAFDSAKTESDESLAANDTFNAQREQLDAVYAMQRKKAKVIFRKDAATCQKLAIDGTLSRVYISWIETIKTFYAVALADSAIAAQLERLKITTADLKAGTAAIASIEALRAAYLKEKGEAQDATQLKLAAFDKLNDWMAEFYAVARIALDDSPQLLEILAKTVKAN
jgi:hypothetical protein